MNYILTKINEDEAIMDIKDGAIMIFQAQKEAKKIAKNENIRILRICQNGVYLMEYFSNLKTFSIAREIG